MLPTVRRRKGLGCLFGGYAVSGEDQIRFPVHHTVEAARLVRVARWTGRAAFQYERIGVAIGAYLFDIEGVPRGFAFSPEFLARPRPKTRRLFLKRYFERFFVHVSHHEDLACVAVLNYGRDQALIIVLDNVKEVLHGRLSGGSRIRCESV